MIPMKKISNKKESSSESTESTEYSGEEKRKKRRPKKKEKKIDVNIIINHFSDNYSKLEGNVSKIKKIFYPSNETPIQLGKEISLFHLPKVIQKYLLKFLSDESLAAFGMTCKTLGKLISLNLEETRTNLLDKTIKLFEKSKNSEKSELRKLIEQSNQEMSRFETNLCSIIICSRYFCSIPNELKDLLSLHSIKQLNVYSMELNILFSAKEGPYVEIPIKMKYQIRYKKLYPFSDKDQKKMPNHKNDHIIFKMDLCDNYENNKVEFNKDKIDRLLPFFPSAFKNKKLIDYLFENKDEEFVVNTFLTELSEHPSFSQLSLPHLFSQLNCKILEQKKKDVAFEITPQEKSEVETKKRKNNFEEKNEIKKMKKYLNDTVESDSDEDDSPKKKYPLPKKSPKINDDEKEKRFSFKSINLLSFVFRKIYEELKIKFPKKEDGSVDIGEINDQAWEKYQSLGIEIPIDNLESEYMDDLINSVKGKQIFQDQLFKILFIRSCCQERYIPKSVEGVTNHYDYKEKVQRNYLAERTEKKYNLVSKRKESSNFSFQSSIKALYVLTKFPQTTFSLEIPSLPIFDDTDSFLGDYSSWLKEMKENPEKTMKKKLEREEKNKNRREKMKKEVKKVN